MKPAIRFIAASLLFFLFIQCHTKPADYGKVVISSQNLNHYADQNFEFTCKDSIEDFDPGYAKIEIKNDTLQLFNSYNNEAESAKITFQILKNLTIKKIEYHNWDDLDDGTTDAIEVIEAEFHMSSNPFTKGTNGLKGNYYLKIKKVNSSLERTVEQNTHIFTLNGILNCP